MQHLSLSLKLYKEIFPDSLTASVGNTERSGKYIFFHRLLSLYFVFYYFFFSNVFICYIYVALAEVISIVSNIFEWRKENLFSFLSFTFLHWFSNNIGWKYKQNNQFFSFHTNLKQVSIFENLKLPNCFYFFFFVVNLG